MANFSGSVHCFVPPVLFERGELRSKGAGMKSMHFNGSHENIELLPRTVISANQLSINGAIADLCNEVPKGVRTLVKPAAPDHLEKMEVPTDLSTAENSTNAQQRKNLVQEYERKFEQLSEDQKISKLCSDAGLKLVRKENTSVLLKQKMENRSNILCRENTMPRNEKGTRVRGWIRKDKRIGPVLNVKVCYRNELYRIEVPVLSLFQDDTASWVRIVNGVDRYVTESLPTAKEEDIAPKKPIATARPRQKSTVTLTSVSIPVLERKWIDIQAQRSHDQKCYRVSTATTRSLRHDESVPRGSDGAQ